jgi:hypothetical protein
MHEDLADKFRPVAPPQIIENAYTADQHQRLLKVIRDNGPWPLILAENFKSPEEVIATTGGVIPEGVTLTWDMIITPVFRGYLARQGVCFYPELNDLYYNSHFLDLARNYWGAKYAEPETLLFNIQGPTPIGGPPHLDGTVFRGMTMENTPLWLLLIMSKSGLFRHWQAKKAQVIGWYYKSKIGGFTCWPDGYRGQPLQIKAPMWGRAIVAENEMMFHHAQAGGRPDMRRPAGLDISSTISAEPAAADGWRIQTEGKINQEIPAEEMRLLVHWGARVFMDFQELKTTLDHTDDIVREQALNMLIADVRKRGVQIETPSDPNDRAFVGQLSQVYNIEGPTNIPADDNGEAVAA